MKRSEDLWLIVGDFDSVVDIEEPTSQGKMNQRKCSSFVSWIFEHGLIDLGFSGPNFTWTRGTSPNSFKGARLDRALSNTNWKIRFPMLHAEVHILPKINSDHSPMLITFSKPPSHPKPNQFKFQAAWLLHPQENWKKGIPFTENNRLIANRLIYWNKEHFGHIEKRKKKL